MLLHVRVMLRDRHGTVLEAEGECLSLPRCLSRRELWLASVAAACWWLSPSRSDAAAPAGWKALLGSYRHAGGDGDRAARDRAIDRVVAEMSVLVRAIVRNRLKSTNPINPKLQLSADAHHLTVKLGARTYSAPLDGSPVTVTGITGDELELRHHVTPTHIEQRFTGPDGGRVNTFTLHHKRLVMSVRVFSPRLPKDLTYKLTYARV
jgi:hypothetical protein